jgi:hypothetical protein
MPGFLPRSPRLLALAPALWLAGCGGPDVIAYRVPKEPEIPPELASAAASTPEAPAAGALVWQSPAAWEAKALTAMRRGSYAIRGPDGGEADFSIIAFPGAAGGLLENINRWRQQVSLPPFSPAQLNEHIRHLDVGPLHFDLVDFAGPLDGELTRITGAVLSHRGESWFFKLMGPDEVVRAAHADFMGLIHSTRPRS